MYNIDNRLSYSLVLKSTLTTIYRYAVCQLWYDWTIVPNGFLKTLWLEDRGFKSLTFPDPCNSLWSFEQGRYILQYFCKRKFSKKFFPKNVIENNFLSKRLQFFVKDILNIQVREIKVRQTTTSKVQD